MSHLPVLVRGQWYCAYLSLGDFGEPAQLPVDKVKVKDMDIHSIGLWRSIYSKERMDEFIHFQDSQNRGA